jgi:23S rRNA (uracil1939-C5)-methyltransferase
MEDLSKSGKKIDAVIMDPPRTGSDRKFLSSLCKLSPEKIVYISCNPETLARDLKFLRAKGYLASKIQPVDMFPHTNHVECVVALHKRKQKKI